MNQELFQIQLSKKLSNTVEIVFDREKAQEAISKPYIKTAETVSGFNKARKEESIFNAMGDTIAERKQIKINLLNVLRPEVGK